jgi:hypothetical protein
MPVNGVGGGSLNVSSSLPTDYLLFTFWPASQPKVQRYNMAANTEQNGYLKDSHKNTLFQKQTDRQATLLKYNG